MANNTTGLTRIIKAAGYSWKGFRAAWVNEAAFRQEGGCRNRCRCHRLLP